MFQNNHYSCTCSLVDKVKENIWIVAVAFLTRKMMIGEMMRTNSRMAIPNACCWLAAFSSLLTVPLWMLFWKKNIYFAINEFTQVFSGVQWVHFWVSQCSQKLQHNIEKLHECLDLFFSGQELPLYCSQLVKNWFLFWSFHSLF